MTDELEAHILAAAKIAAKVPPDLRVAAFQSAIDALLGPNSQRELHRRRPSRKPKSTRRKAGNVKAKSGVSKGSGGGSGGKAQLQVLLQEGYFKQPHSLPEIVDHLKHAKARQFKQNNLSGPLGRMTRDGELKRAKNADGKYEYTV